MEKQNVHIVLYIYIIRVYFPVNVACTQQYVRFFFIFLLSFLFILRTAYGKREEEKGMYIYMCVWLPTVEIDSWVEVQFKPSNNVPLCLVRTKKKRNKTEPCDRHTGLAMLCRRTIVNNINIISHPWIYPPPYSMLRENNHYK